MDFDLLKNPPSRAELDAKQQHIQTEINMRLYQDKGKQFVLTLILLISSVFLYQGVVYDFMPKAAVPFYSLFIIYCLVILFTIVRTNSNIHSNSLRKVLVIQNRIDSLSEAPSVDCLAIKDWIAGDEIIRQYRDKVVNSGRKFVVQEVRVMRMHYANREKKAAADAQATALALKIDNACREVYLPELSSKLSDKTA